MKFLVAGLSGQLGAGLSEVAGARADITLTALARPARAGRLAGRAQRTVPGDVAEPGWGIADQDLRALASQVDAVINLAGDTNWASSGRSFFENNALGALHGLEVARALTGLAGRPVAYCYASSVYVAGGLLGDVPESPLPQDRWRTRYEHSKWLAERWLAENFRVADPPVLIARVSALLGNSVTGGTSRRSSLYMLMDHWDRLPLRLVPAMPGARVDALPRDVAAEFLVRAVAGLVAREPGEPLTAHVAAGENAPTLRGLLEEIAVAGSFRVRHRLRVVPAGAETVLWLSQNLHRFANLPANWSNVAVGLRYLALDRCYERAVLRGLTGGAAPDVPVRLLARLTLGLGEPPAARPALASDPGLARYHP